MPCFFIETFGCQMNVADSAALHEAFLERGYEPVEDPAAADILIVNTCSVRERAENRALARIRSFRRLHTPGKELWVVGCMAERVGEKLKATIPGVTRVLGAPRLENIDAIMANVPASSGSSPRADSASLPPSMFLPVMRGCDNYCAYCVVPYVRGREHSVSAADCERKLRELAKRGVREVTLLGQNVNSYRDGKTTFPRLLRRLSKVEGIKRIRFTTSHPKDCSGELIDVMASCPKICSHLHLPVQSGSTAILRRMNRGYTRDSYLDLVHTIRTAIPHIDITTDVMVGFPGETEHDFFDTLSLMDEVRFTTAFMFAFSAREETAAATMRNQIPDTEKKTRLAELISRQTAITKSHYRRAVGTDVDGLFTQRQEKPGGLWIGRDRGCKRLLMACEKPVAGMIFKARAIRTTGMTLICERGNQ